jgi:hypothetical protein
LPDRVRSLVYLDAFVPEDGKSLVDHLPDAADAAWVDRQCTMHLLSSLED